MLIPLSEAEAETCGAKAAGLGALLRAGLLVPDGFVVPFSVYRAVNNELAEHVQAGAHSEVTSVMPVPPESRPNGPLPRFLLDALERALNRLGARAMAVRSSATGEDTMEASAAGQYESVLAAQGLPAVADAIRTCWASLLSEGATVYRSRICDGLGGDALAMAVIVQRHLDAEVSGVMFTPASPADATAIDSTWGLGPSVVAGTVTPDTYRVRADGTVTSIVGDKRTRLDRIGTRPVVGQVPADRRQHPSLDQATARELATLGEQVAETLGGPQGIEWAVADGRVWLLLQTRPITVAPPLAASPPSPPSPASPISISGSSALTGTPGSHGIATGTARAVRGLDDFARVRRGDILVCPFTDPAWTPLLRLVAGVVTETGGALPRRHRRSRARHPGRARCPRRTHLRSRRRHRHDRRRQRHRARPVNPSELPTSSWEGAPAVAHGARP